MIIRAAVVQRGEKLFGELVAAMLRCRAHQLDLDHRQPNPGQAPLLTKTDQTGRQMTGGGVLHDQEVVGYDRRMPAQQIVDPCGDPRVRFPAGRRLQLDGCLQTCELIDVRLATAPNLVMIA